MNMNKTKKTLIILSIIFALGDIAWAIYDIVEYFKLDVKNRSVVIYLVFNFIDIALSITVMTLLTIVIWNNGKYFRARYGMYMTALMLSIFMNLFSISTILLISTMFCSDWVWVKEKKEKIDETTEVINESREEKIARLRAKKERGEISEEEFQKEIVDLL